MTASLDSAVGSSTPLGLGRTLKLDLWISRAGDEVAAHQRLAWNLGARGRTILAFVRLGRLHFLTGGFLLYGLGAAVAVATGSPFDPGLYALGQGGIVCVQLMTHYANEYFDLAADLANVTPTRWSGGSRVLTSGVVAPGVALLAGRVLAVVGLVWAAALMKFGGGGGPAAAAALVLAEALGWFYSAPPVALHSRGLGELTTALVVTGLTPVCGFVLQCGDLSRAWESLPLLVCALIPLAALQFSMLLTIEFPDAAGDLAAGKRTLVVRLGAARAAALWRAILVAIYGSLPLLARGGLPVVAVLSVAAASPIAAWQFWRLGRRAWADPRRWESLAFWSVALLVSTAAGELAAFIWLAVQVSPRA